MRLWIRATELPEPAIVRGILAGERVLAEHGVTLPACLEALAALARKEAPSPALAVFDSAEQEALRAAFGSRERAGDAALVLLLGPGDEALMPWAEQAMHAC